MRLLTLGLILVKERIADIYGRRAVRRFLEFDGIDYIWEGSLFDMILIGGQRHGAVLAGATPYMRIAADANSSKDMFIIESFSGKLGDIVRRTIAYNYRTYDEVEAPEASSTLGFGDKFSVVVISTKPVSARSASRYSMPSGEDISKSEDRIFIPNAWPSLLL